MAASNPQQDEAATVTASSSPVNAPVEPQALPDEKTGNNTPATDAPPWDDKPAAAAKVTAPSPQQSPQPPVAKNSEPQNTASQNLAPQNVEKQPEAAAPTPSPAEPLPSTLSLESLTPANWSQVFEQLGFGGVVGNIASHCVLQSIDGDKVHLLLDENNATLFNDNYSNRIESHLSVTLNAPIKLLMSVGPVTAETPAVLKERVKGERKQQALVSLQNDPNIQVLVSDFGAVLDETTVEPV